MRIVIVHYHFHPGGVTSIIRSQIRTLLENTQFNIVLILGEIEDTKELVNPRLSVIINPLLKYLPEKTRIDQELNEVFNSIITFLKKTIKKEDIIHAHNINLGKNPLLLLALNQLAGEDYRVLNHCHDFPEDRPKNMLYLKNVIETRFGKDLNNVLYNSSHNNLYAVLNSFDYSRLIGYGIKVNELFILPNPVIAGISPDKKKCRKKIYDILKLDKEKLLVTYPVRVIKRKNIGEFIFLAVLYSDKANWCVTQPPKNPEEKSEYQKWKDFCGENNINVIFEAGLKVDYNELIVASDFCITTSLREGFGMVFLEPWLKNVPVIGRNIDYITKDLKNDGLFFSMLYDNLMVKGKKGATDFKEINIAEQKELIIKLKTISSFKAETEKENPFLNFFLMTCSPEIIKRNKEIIKEKYSLEKYAERLERIYYQFT